LKIWIDMAFTATKTVSKTFRNTKIRTTSICGIHNDLWCRDGLTILWDSTFHVYPSAAILVPPRMACGDFTCCADFERGDKIAAQYVMNGKATY